MNDDAAPLVVRSDFCTTDTDLAEELLRREYADNTLTITGVEQDFRFAHSAAVAPGFSLNRVQFSVDVDDKAVTGPENPFTVVQPVSGRMTHTESAYPDVSTDAGGVVLFPPTGAMRITCERFDFTVVQLDRAAVATYAAAMTGLDADDLVFDHIAPMTAALTRHWTRTVTHVRDDVLADPWTAHNPILLDQATRTLTAALLSAFPNNALGRMTDDRTPAVRGDVSPARLREVVDYLHSHADRFVGPSDIADLTGIPTALIINGLRRQGSPHPAELLWRFRLRGVRRDLLDADPPDLETNAGAPTATRDTITRIASRWGFVHPRRFRVTYRRAFDETPEQTLSRWH